jgi:hypothetical protein
MKLGNRGLRLAPPLWLGGKNPKNDEQFVSAAAAFAKSYGTLGVGGDEKSGGKLIFGRAIEIASRGEVTQAITSVHETVHQLASARKLLRAHDSRFRDGPRG